ncbi:major facilitator superfamily (MFS) transporter [Candidatus Koribacter versatilis Ellin345]|uniref:Major facilitator superfamily (MFS) transporter n=2 Tax=Candidatus Korobacter versatilis TaxID=658062 RepID=Q1IP19_KORVE|nr:major facilitator superfamily (MFS) transporter [Candidatus Koribacter versatilis Ellin345]
MLEPRGTSAHPNGKMGEMASHTPAGEGIQKSKFLNRLPALKVRNFQLFFAGQLISLIGTWMDNVAEAWLIYRLTGSSLKLGTVGFCSQIPVFLFAPLGGIVADRYNRHKIIIATQATSMVLAGILAILTLTHRVQVWHVFLLAALMGVVNAFDIPARQAFLSDMVGRENLMNAIALNSSMFNGARIVGPAVAGILVASIGEGWCFGANSLSYIAVITGLLMMKLNLPVRIASGKSPLQDIVEGFQFVKEAAPIRTLLLLLGLVSLVGMPYSVLMPIFADHILHGGARGLGILMGATGVGALGGALTLALKNGLKGISRIISYCAFGFGTSLILFSFSRWFWLSAALLIPVGYSMMVQMASSNTLLQSMTPDRLRGRVLAVYSMMFMGMAPFGALFAGAIAERIGAPWTVAVGGVACICGGLFFRRNLATFRDGARKMVLAQQMVGGEPAPEVTAGSLVPATDAELGEEPISSTS